MISAALEMLQRVISPLVVLAVCLTVKHVTLLGLQQSLLSDSTRMTLVDGEEVIETNYSSVRKADQVYLLVAGIPLMTVLMLAHFWLLRYGRFYSILTKKS